MPRHTCSPAAAAARDTDRRKTSPGAHATAAYSAIGSDRAGGKRRAKTAIRSGIKTTILPAHLARCGEEAKLDNSPLVIGRSRNRSTTWIGGIATMARDHAAAQFPGRRQEARAHREGIEEYTRS